MPGKNHRKYKYAKWTITQLFNAGELNKLRGLQEYIRTRINILFAKQQKEKMQNSKPVKIQPGDFYSQEIKITQPERFTEQDIDWLSSLTKNKNI